MADPGADLAAACAEEGIRVVPVPGACAPAAAMGASGLPSESFTFVGFPPTEPGKRRKRLERFAGAPGSVVAFVPPHKLVATLEDAAAVFGGEEVRGVPRDDQGATAARVFPRSVSLALDFLIPGGSRPRASRQRARAFATERARAFATERARVRSRLASVGSGG